MDKLKLFENFDKKINENYWQTEMSDYIKSERRDLEKANNITKADIDDVISGFETMHKDSEGSYDDKFRFVGSYFGFEDDEVESMMSSNENEVNEKTAEEHNLDTLGNIDQYLLHYAGDMARNEWEDYADEELGRVEVANWEDYLKAEGSVGSLIDQGQAIIKKHGHTDDYNTKVDMGMLVVMANEESNQMAPADDVDTIRSRSKDKAEAEAAFWAKSKEFNKVLDKNIPLNGNTDIRKEANKLAEKYEWKTDEIIALTYNMLVTINEHELVKDFVEIVKKHR